ncbi:MAG: Chromate resistance protein ChrB [Rubrobacteraceae bacterium]
MTIVEKDGEREWFVLVYKLPSEPSRYRASVWRKLKAAGAVYLQNGVAALPNDPGGERTMRGVEREIREVGGTTHLFRGASMGGRGELEKIFDEARDAEYAEVMGRCRDFHAELDKERSAGNLTFAELEEKEEDLAKLEAWVGKIRVRDRFGAPLFEEVERELVACREDLQAFAASVYEAADHGSAGSS